MAKTPFYRVIAQTSGRDLTDFIKGINIIDSIDQTDVVTLSMDGVELPLLDDKVLSNGIILIYSFGYYAGKYSGERKARITNINVRYGPTISVTVKATDLGIVLKKGMKKRVWQNQSAEEIISQITSEKGLKLEMSPNINGVNELNKKIAFFPQTNEDDYSTIKKILAISGNGEFIVYTRGESVVVKPRGLGDRSKRTYTYNEGNGGVISFSVNENDTAKSEFAVKSNVSSFSPFDGEAILSEVLGEETPEPKLAPQSSKFIVEGAENYGDVVGRGVEPEPVQGELIEPVVNSQESKTKANKKSIESSLSGIKATLVVEGDPIIRADQVVTMSNVSKKHQGNWYVNKVTHKVDSSGFITTIALQRNSTSKALNSNNASSLGNVNDSTGPKETDNKKTVSTFIVN